MILNTCLKFEETGTQTVVLRLGKLSKQILMSAHVEESDGEQARKSLRVFFRLPAGACDSALLVLVLIHHVTL